MVKRKRYTQDELTQILANEVSEAEGSLGDEVQENRAQALQYMKGDPLGNEKPGRSQVISMDVSDMIEAVNAMLSPMIAIDAVVNFEPQSDEDVNTAEAESEAVNTLIMQDNLGFMEFQTAIKDALLLRNGWTKVYIETTTKTYNIEFEDDDLEPAQIAYLLEPIAQTERRELVDEYTIRVTDTKHEFKMKAVDSVNMVYEPHACTMDLEELRIIAEKVVLTRSDLVQRGISKKKVADLDSIDVDTEIDALERSRRQHLINDAETWEGERIQCWEIYYLIDMDGDGIAERWRFLMAGDGQNPSVLLEQEQVMCVPYATGTAILYPHRLMGQSLFDKLKHVQDAKTGGLRQWLDNLVAGNNNRIAAVENMVNMDDLLNARPNGIVRTTDIGAVMPLPYADTGPSAQMMMDYMDKVRTERGGAALDMMGAEAQMVGQTAFGTERIYSSREQMVSCYARNLAETLIRNTYALMHKYLRYYSNEPIMVQIAGQYQAVDPTTWPERKRINVTAGLSPGQRNHIQNTLSMWFQVQSQMMSMGVPLASPQTLHKTALDWFRMAGLENPETYMVDPDSPMGQQIAQSQQEQAAQQAQQAQAQQEAILAIQVAMEEKKLQEDARQHDDEIQFKYFDAKLDADVKEADTLAKSKTELYKAGMNADAQERASERSAAISGGNSQ